MPKRLPVLIIGTGLAGLATAALLRARNTPFLVFDAATHATDDESLAPAFALAPCTAAEQFCSDARIPWPAAAKASLKVVADGAGPLATGAVSFAMKTAASTFSGRINVRTILGSTERAENRLDEFYATKEAGPGQALLEALTGTEGAEPRTTPRNAFALAREVLLNKKEIIVFDGGRERFLDACRQKIEFTNLSGLVASVAIDNGRASGVVLDDGTIVEGDAVILAVPAATARTLIGSGWSFVSAEERWKFEAATPRPGVHVHTRFATAVAEPFFAFCHDPAAFASGIGTDLRMHVGLPVDTALSPDAVHDLAKAVLRRVREIPGIPECNETSIESRFMPFDDPICTLAGARERPHHSIDGFDNLMMVGESTDATGTGIERVLASARVVARRC